jgi:hypothetical protein
MEFVVNEWLPEYFKATAHLHERKKLQHFLNTFLLRGDKIYVRRPSPFLVKIERLAKDFQQNDIQQYRELKKFYSTILLDSDRCKFIKDGEFELPETTRKKLISGGNTISDVYLFEAASATTTKIILTTDAKLKALMEEDGNFKIHLLDSFLKNYQF